MRMATRKSKPVYQKAVRLNITLPPELHEKLPQVIRKHGYSGPADYFQGRLRKDAGLELAA